LFSQASHNSRLSAVPPLPGRPEVLARVRALIAGLRPDDVDLLEGMHRLQHEFGYIPREAIPLLAEQFATTPAIIFGTIDFYADLRTLPPGENVVEWCSGPACLVKNSLGIRRALEAELGCFLNEVSADGRFELRLVQCDGTCHLAPLVRYRGACIGPLSVSAAIKLARDLKAAAPAADAATRAAHQEARADLNEAIEERGGLGAAAPVEGGGEAASGLPERQPKGPRPPATPDEDPTRAPGE
jgi:NADH:ubiquinone oxidoreductase subunit E